MKQPFKIKHLTFIISLFLYLQVLGAAPFVNNGDITVTDKATGLIWQRCSMPTADDVCSGTASSDTWAKTLTYCNGLTLAGRTWRLPNVNELKSIVDRSKASGATIDLTVFPATAASNYWSSSTYVPSTTVAWGVDFVNGAVNGYGKTGNSYVRCVSTGP